MNKQKTQSGFAHLMIFAVVIALILIGLLGFVFWKSFFDKKDANQPTVVTEQAAYMANSATIKLDGVDAIDIKYPSSWVKNNTTNQLDKTIDKTGYQIGIQANDEDYLKNTYGGNATVIKEITNVVGTKLYAIKTADEYVAVSSCVPDGGFGCSVKSGDKYIFMILHGYEKGDQYVRELDFSRTSTDSAIDDFIKIAKSTNF